MCIFTSMKIEDAIQQKRPFRNEYHRAVVNLIYSSNWVQERHRAFLKQYDLTLKQYNVLRILKGADAPISTSVIRERLLDKNADVSRIVARLSKKRLVSKKVSKVDKRLVEIILTKEAVNLLMKTTRKEKNLESVLHQLSEKEAKQLNNLLNKLRSSE